MTTINRYVNIVAAPASFWAAVICCCVLTACLLEDLVARCALVRFFSSSLEGMLFLLHQSSSWRAFLSGQSFFICSPDFGRGRQPCARPPSFLIWAWDWPGWRSSQSWCLLKDSRFIISSNVGEEVTKKKKPHKMSGKETFYPHLPYETVKTSNHTYWIQISLFYQSKTGRKHTSIKPDMNLAQSFPNHLWSGRKLSN